LQLAEVEVQELEQHDGFYDHLLSSMPNSPTMPPASPIKAFLKLPEIAQLNNRRHLELVQWFVKTTSSHITCCTKSFCWPGRN